MLDFLILLFGWFYAFLVIFTVIVIPVAMLVFFIVSLCRFVSAKKKNRQVPGTFDKNQIMIRTIVLVVSSVLVLVPLALMIGIILLFTGAIAFM